MTDVDSGAGVDGRLAAPIASDPDLPADPYPLDAELRERSPVCDLGAVFLTTVATRYPGLRLAADPSTLTWSGSAMLRSPNAVPVALA